MKNISTNSFIKLMGAFVVFTVFSACADEQTKSESLEEANSEENALEFDAEVETLIDEELNYMESEFNLASGIDLNEGDATPEETHSAKKGNDSDWKLDLSELRLAHAQLKYDAEITRRVCKNEATLSKQESITACTMTAYEEFIHNNKKYALAGMYKYLAVIYPDGSVEKLDLKSLFGSYVKACKVKRHIDSIAISMAHKVALFTIGDCYAELKGIDFHSVLHSLNNKKLGSLLSQNKLMLSETKNRPGYLNKSGNDRDSFICSDSSCKIEFSTALDYYVKPVGDGFALMLGSKASKAFNTLYYDEVAKQPQIIDSTPIKKEYVSRQICMVLAKETEEKVSCKLIAMSVAQENNYSGRHNQSYIIQFGHIMAETKDDKKQRKIPRLIKVDLVDNKYVSIMR